MNQPHPFDPLSESEIKCAVAVVKKQHHDVHFNAVTLYEPRKAEMSSWLAEPKHSARPKRVADVVAIGKGCKVFDALVDLDKEEILQWEWTQDVQPLVSFLVDLF